MMAQAKRVCIGVLSAVLCCKAAAQSSATMPDSADDRYEFTLTPGLWLPRLGGELPGDILVEEELDLDSSESVANVEFTMRKDDYWQLDFSGFDFDTSNSDVFAGNENVLGLDLDQGDQFAATFNMTSAAVELAWWQWDLHRIGEVRNGKASRVDLRFAPLVALRYLDIEQTLAAPAGFADENGEWLAAMGGFHLQMRYDTRDSFPLVDRLDVDGTLALGPAFGGDGGAMAQIRASLTANFDQHFGLTFGYRLLHVDVENEPYEFAGGLQGLFIAGVIRF
jgi:hypothetical protein